MYMRVSESVCVCGCVELWQNIRAGKYYVWINICMGVDFI